MIDRHRFTRFSLTVARDQVIRAHVAKNWLGRLILAWKLLRGAYWAIREGNVIAWVETKKLGPVDADFDCILEKDPFPLCRGAEGQAARKKP